MIVGDATLWERWRTQRDADAFAELVSRYSGMVYATCKRVLRNAADAEDAAQECFLDLMRASVTVRSSLAPWLHTVALRRSRDRIKVDARRRSREKQFVAEQNTCSETDLNDLLTHIDEAIAELPEKLRAPVIHRLLEGRTHAAIAQTLGVAESTVRYRIDKGVKRIRATLKRRGVHIGTAGLAAMMGANLAEATPASLTAMLGKVAIAGDVGPALSGTAAGGTAAASTAIIGGTAIMAKKALVALGAIALVLALTYSVTHRPAKIVVEEEADTALETTKPTQATPAEDEALVLPAEEPGTSVVAVSTSDDEEEPQPEQKEDTLQTASISGSVIDSEGYPLGDANVRVEVGEDRTGHSIVKVYEGETASDGMYGITGIDVVEGAFAYGYASAKGYETGHVYALDLLPGKALDGVNFTLPRGRFFVSGWVVSERRDPISGASVNLRHCGYEEGGLGALASTDKWAYAITDEDGRFEMAIRHRGLCDFTVIKEGYGTGFFSKVPTGSDDEVFVLRSGGAIAGRVTEANGSPVEGAAVEVAGMAFAGDLAVVDIPGRPFPMKPEPLTVRPVVAVTDAQGDYRADGLGEDYLYTATVIGSDRHSMDVEGAGLQKLARFVRLSNDRLYGKTGAAQRKGIRVEAGRTTSGVDFVLGLPTSGTVHGKVTDPTSGLPVCPLIVGAELVDPGGEIHVVLGGVTVTGPDGSYDLTVNLSETHSFHIWYLYCEGNGPTITEVARIELAPGTQKELNFEAHAPVTVPVRYLDGNGVPLQGIDASIRSDGRQGEWGAECSDADGRVVWYGLEPGRTLQALGRSGDQLIGKSKPFTGEPGETVPEIEVVCAPYGGIEGVCVDAAGTPLANTVIGCRALLPDGTISAIRTGVTDANGVFCMLDVLEDGAYPSVFVGSARATDQIELAIIENVEIVGDAVTDLGTVQLAPISPEEAAAILRR